MKQALDFLSENDPIFKHILDKYGPPPIPSRPPGFATLVLLILEQQVSIDSAKATFLKIKAKAPAFLPQDLIRFSDEDFRNLGVSRQKTAYIKGLAEAIVNKSIDLENLASKSPEEIRHELIKLKGIGNWTIDTYLMLSLDAPDVIPLADIGVINTIKELLDIHTREEMEAYVAKWSPYRTMATFLLWHYYLRKRNRTVNYNP